MSGLNIAFGEFESLSTKKQNIIIYKNVLEIKKNGINFKLQTKINYIWLSALTIALGLKKFMGL